MNNTYEEMLQEEEIRLDKEILKFTEKLEESINNNESPILTEIYKARLAMLEIDKTTVRFKNFN